MHARLQSEPLDGVRIEAERIASAYQQAARGDARAALVQAVEDALNDLAVAEQRLDAQRQAVSRGYVRGRVGTN